MMNKKKLLSTICAAALTVSVVGGSIVSAAAADKNADLLRGKVTDIEGTTVTLQLGGPMGGQKDDGLGQLPPAKPDGDTLDDLTPPAKPEDDTQDSQTPPAKPEDDTQDSQTPPAKPEGDTQDDLTPPEKPEDGEEADRKQPPEAKSVEVDVSNATITEDGEAAAAADIAVGDMLTIKLDEDGNAVSVSIDNLPAKADLADKPDDGLDPSEKPDPIDDDFTQPEQPASDDRFAPDDAFDPDDKPVSDDRFAPQDKPAADGQFTAAGQPMANGGAQVNAPRGNGFGGKMMGFGMMAQDDAQL